jgi:cellobiose-specific phosphotransferase system component IIA
MQHIGMYLKLFLLLHADDTVMLAESAEELQYYIADLHS